MNASKNSAGLGAALPPYVVVDSQDPDRITPFWCALLDVEVGQYRDDGHYVTLEPAPSLPGSMRLVFQRVPEQKVGKNRAHIDMYVDDLDVATARVEELGGRWTEPGSTVHDGGWMSRAMADPEGNEFCICLLHPDMTG